MTTEREARKLRRQVVELAATIRWLLEHTAPPATCTPDEWDAYVRKTQQIREYLDALGD